MSQAGAAVAYDQSPTPKIKPTPRERALQDDVRELRAHIAKDKDTIVDLREQITDLTAELASVTSDFEDARREIDAAMDRVADMDQQITALVRVRNLMASCDTRDALREIEDVLHHLDSAWSCRGAGVL